MNAQHIDIDSLKYTTAKVELVKHQATPCHVDLIYFTFKVVEHINGPAVPKGSTVITTNLRGYINGDATKISQELYYGEPLKEYEAHTLVINFAYNPSPQRSPVEYPRLCGNVCFWEYGIAYIRWAARENRYHDMIGLDAFMQSKFKKKFHLMAEREGKFPFEHNKKQLLAFKMYHDWKIAEIK